VSEDGDIPGAVAAPDGAADVERAAAELADRIPEPLAPMARLAYNYRWAWLPGGPELFASVDSERFELCLQNPVRLLQEAPSRALRRAAADERLVSRAAELEAQLREDLARPPGAGIDPRRPIAFLCAEYGVHVSLPVYSGGLGALAGDLLKEASDRAVPMVAVGLMYRKGYFRQRIDASGWQHEYWIDSDPQRLPAARVTTADESPLEVQIPIYDAEVTAHVWRVDVGRVPLFLLDTDIAHNGPVERWITARLYEADPTLRLAQYVLLGAGGVRALRAMGIDPSVIHLNEGHAALAPLSLAGLLQRNGASSVATALEQARARTVFTTHTPVPAGNDSYPSEQVNEAIARLAGELAVPADELISLGRTRPDDASEPFGVTQAALRMSRAANGVSRRHGEVSRGMWAPLWPDRPTDQVPIGYVTNGVHVPTWIGAPMRELLDRHLGADWMTRAADPRTWAAVDQIPDEELWRTREQQRAEMVEFIRRRSTQDRLLRGDRREYVDAAARAFDDHVLTIGFARRVATYKRLQLLTRDPEWTLRLLGGERPVQVVLAGKAHPRDEEAKHMLQHMFALKSAHAVAQHVVYLDDYDLATAAMLVRGCDVWLNVPRPPLEASGTSGMKSAFNGGLQVSVLDGWWAEAYDGENGWALPGEVLDDAGAQDQRDAALLHAVLDDQVVPAFYERDERGLPPAWLMRMRASLQSLGPRFCATRMLSEYVNGPYQAPQPA
jgi:glycogen phosphorylase